MTHCFEEKNDRCTSEQQYIIVAVIVLEGTRLTSTFRRYKLLRVWLTASDSPHLSGCCSVLLPLLLLPLLLPLLLLGSDPFVVSCEDAALLFAASAASEMLVCMRGSTVLKGAMYSAGVTDACDAALEGLFACWDATFPSLRAALHRHRLIGTPRSKLTACRPVACRLTRVLCCLGHVVRNVQHCSVCISGPPFASCNDSAVAIARSLTPALCRRIAL
jgi:hypothetical protein